MCVGLFCAYNRSLLPYGRPLLTLTHTSDLSLTLGRQLDVWLHPASAGERERIREAGQRHVLANHTHLARLEYLLRAVARAEEVRLVICPQLSLSLYIYMCVCS